MANPELLALLTAHGIEPGKVHGGTPSITQMDVAGMMARCAPCESALLRAKYCGESIHDAWAYWFEHLKAQKWKTKAGQVDTLSKISLLEHVSDNRCGLCSGTQGWFVGNSYQTCPLCEGSGVQFLKPSEIASRLGVERLGIWADRLGWCRKELIRWEHGALEKFR